MLQANNHALAEAGDNTFLQARAAYDKKNDIALSQYVTAAKSTLYSCALRWLLADATEFRRSR